MAEATLAVTARDRAGKGAARAERRAGRIPAVIYGGKADPVMISVEPKDLMREMNAGQLFSTVYNLDVAGTNERVLPRDVQYHPVTDRAQHVDFLRVTADTKLPVEVPCNFINEDDCPGLRRGGTSRCKCRPPGSEGGGGAARAWQLTLEGVFAARSHARPLRLHHATERIPRWHAIHVQLE